MEFDWDTANVAHIARHGITPGGVRGSLLERADGDRSPGTEARTPEPVPGGDPPDARETAGDLSRRGMMPTSTRVPNFKSEKEEAEWWDAHPEVVTALFLKAKKEGKIKRLPVVRGATRSTTIRLPIADIETAQQIAEKRGLPYQTYLKGLLHQALERERKAE